MKKKSEITIFGENSLAHVKEYGHTFSVVRDCDHQVLAISHRFGQYKNCPIRTMYTGLEYATGDYILVADTPKKQEEIYMFHD